jgi:outer membrane immunogenic protein
MKRLLLAAGAVVLSIASAHAADMAVKAPVYTKAIAAPYSWSGWYLGVNAGIGVGRDFTGENFGGATPASYFGPLGAIGGGQIGYNWQLGNWVLGLESDIQASGMQDSYGCGLLCNGNGSLTWNQKLSWFGTTRARLGLASGPVLSYVTAGAAYGGVQTSVTNSVIFAGTGGATFKDTRGGWTVGSGVEASLGGYWTGKIEYLYVDLGTQKGAYNFVGVVPTFIGSDIRENIFRAGLNYRIGGNAVTAPMPVANWSGLYIGGNVGSGYARDRSTNVLATLINNESTELMPQGYLGGAQLGYNWQASNWVFGLLGDIQGSTQKDDKSCELSCIIPAPGPQFVNYDQRLPWLATARARLGYSVGSSLFYATGGLAYGEVKTRMTELNFGAQITPEFKHDKSGYAVGGGLETPFDLFGLFGRNWTSNTEYLYVDLGKTSDGFTSGGIAGTFTTRVQEHIFRTGLNYHFNAPVVAKY